MSKIFLFRKSSPIPTYAGCFDLDRNRTDESVVVLKETHRQTLSVDAKQRRHVLKNIQQFG
jgi:hypothetical protein